MKLKKKEGQNGDVSVLLRKENKTLMGGSLRSNRGTGIEEKITQKPPYLGIHHICSHQIQALQLIPKSTYWQRPDGDAPSGTMLESYRYS